MHLPPAYEIRVYSNGDSLPAEAERLFEAQLADSRSAAAAGLVSDSWSFVLVCAVTADNLVLGGVHLDIGPIGGAARWLPKNWPTWSGRWSCPSIGVMV